MHCLETGILYSTLQNRQLAGATWCSLQPRGNLSKMKRVSSWKFSRKPCQRESVQLSAGLVSAASARLLACPTFVPLCWVRQHLLAGRPLLQWLCPHCSSRHSHSSLDVADRPLCKRASPSDEGQNPSFFPAFCREQTRNSPAGSGKPSASFSLFALHSPHLVHI